MNGRATVLQITLGRAEQRFEARATLQEPCQLESDGPESEDYDPSVKNATENRLCKNAAVQEAHRKLNQAQCRNADCNNGQLYLYT